LLKAKFRNRAANRRFYSINAVSISSARTFLRGHYKTKLTANSCIARSSSKNAVYFIRPHDESLAVAMRVYDPARSPITIDC
jgi:hypothetical protein